MEMTEKLDLGRLAKLAVVHRKEGTPFVSVTPDEIDSLIARIRALESRASNAGRAVYQALHVDTCTWEDVTAEYYTERLPSNRRILYTHPAPASKEPVADERAALYQAIHDALMEHGLSYTEDTGSGEKFPLVDKLCAPGDKTIQTGKDEIAILADTILDAIPPARAALATAQTWQPIETAPKDGYAILALLPDSDIAQPIWYDEDKWRHKWDNYVLKERDRPTHWMPLPAAPAKPEGV